MLYLFCSWLDVGGDDGKVKRVLKLKGKFSLEPFSVAQAAVLNSRINSLYTTFKSLLALEHASCATPCLLGKKEKKKL